MERRKIRDAADAQECLAAAATASQPPTEWARANGVDARSLNCWRLGPPKRAPREIQLVELVPTPTPAPVTPPSRYLVHVGEFSIEVDASFDPQILGKFLRVVAEC